MNVTKDETPDTAQLKINQWCQGSDILISLRIIKRIHAHAYEYLIRIWYIVSKTNVDGTPVIVFKDVVSLNQNHFRSPIESKVVHLFSYLLNRLEMSKLHSCTSTFLVCGFNQKTIGLIHGQTL